MNNRRWTQEEIEYLEKNYARKDTDKICEKLGRSKRSVVVKASKLGLMKAKYWTDEEINYVQEKYGVYSASEIAKKFKRSTESVYHLVSKHDVGHFVDLADGISVSDCSRLLGISRNRMLYLVNTKKAIKSKKKDNYRLVNFEDLVRFMKANPSKYSAMKCDQVVFDSYPWFHEKLLEERAKAFDERWNV